MEFLRNLVPWFPKFFELWRNYALESSLTAYYISIESHLLKSVQGRVRTLL